jgi:hypothetical protein
VRESVRSRAEVQGRPPKVAEWSGRSAGLLIPIEVSEEWKGGSAEADHGLMGPDAEAFPAGELLMTVFEGTEASSIAEHHE